MGFKFNIFVNDELVEKVDLEIPGEDVEFIYTNVGGSQSGAGVPEYVTEADIKINAKMAHEERESDRLSKLLGLPVVAGIEPEKPVTPKKATVKASAKKS